MYELYEKAEAFILSSLWEDPGSVLTESAIQIYILFQAIVKMVLKNF